METALLVGLFGLFGSLIGGLVTLAVARWQFENQLKVIREQFRTEFVAEETARYFLNHKAHIYRTFDTLKKHLGGFGDDELRKILVRAGAVRVYRRTDKSEMWYLLSRSPEIAARKEREELEE
jgi:hypothetical protein